MTCRTIPAAVIERARRLSEVHPRYVVAQIVGVSVGTLTRAKQRGWQPVVARKRPVPNDWGLVAPGRGVNALAAHYRASQTTVLRWLREKPMPRPYVGGVPWQPPTEFADLLDRHTMKDVAAMLGVTEHTVLAARRRLGIHPKQIAARRSTGWAERYVTTSTGAPA